MFPALLIIFQPPGYSLSDGCEKLLSSGMFSTSGFLYEKGSMEGVSASPAGVFNDYQVPNENIMD